MKIDKGQLRLLHLYARDGGKCRYTGLPLLPFIEIGEVSEDHILPLAKNGPNTLDNIALVPHWVNQMKKEMLPDEFIEWLKQHGLPHV